MRFAGGGMAWELRLLAAAVVQIAFCLGVAWLVEWALSAGAAERRRIWSRGMVRLWGDTCRPQLKQ